MTLLDAAREVRERAYAPYSRFKVGAAVRGASGAVYQGCNVENVAYPEGTCAEAGAIAAMIAAGGTVIRALLVFGEGAELVTPCGACRQRIREFAVATTTVHLRDGSGAVTSLAAADLLPLSFGPDHL